MKKIFLLRIVVLTMTVAGMHDVFAAKEWTGAKSAQMGISFKKALDNLSKIITEVTTMATNVEAAKNAKEIKAAIVKIIQTSEPHATDTANILTLKNPKLTAEATSTFKQLADEVGKITNSINEKIKDKTAATDDLKAENVNEEIISLTGNLNEVYGMFLPQTQQSTSKALEIFGQYGANLRELLTLSGMILGGKAAEKIAEITTKAGIDELSKKADFNVLIPWIQDLLASGAVVGKGGGITLPATLTTETDKKAAEEKIGMLAGKIKDLDDVKMGQIANIPTAIDELVAYSAEMKAGNVPKAFTDPVAKAIHEAAMSTSGAVTTAIAALSAGTKATLENINTIPDLKSGLESVGNATVTEVGKALTYIGDGTNELSLGLKAIKDDAAVVNGLKAIKDDAAVVNGLKAVATGIANINTVATANANITAVATDIANINTVATDIANINTVATANANINTVATNMTAIQAALAAHTGGANAALIATETARADAKIATDIAAEATRVDAKITAETARVDAKIVADIAVETARVDTAFALKADKTALATEVAKLATKADVTTALASITAAAKTIADAITTAAAK